MLTLHYQIEVCGTAVLIQASEGELWRGPAWAGRHIIRPDITEG